MERRDGKLVRIDEGGCERILDEQDLVSYKKISSKRLEGNLRAQAVDFQQRADWVRQKREEVDRSLKSANRT